MPNVSTQSKYTKRGGGVKIYKTIFRITSVIIVTTCLFGCRGTNQIDELDELEEWDLVYISDSTGWAVAARIT